MARWIHIIQQFQFSIVHRAGRDDGNADGLSRAPTPPCRQYTRVNCPPVDTTIEVVDQPFDAESVGDSEDADLVPLQSGEDWVAQLDDNLSRPASQSGDIFRITRGFHVRHVIGLDPVCQFSSLDRSEGLMPGAAVCVASQK